MCMYKQVCTQDRYTITDREAEKGLTEDVIFE